MTGGNSHDAAAAAGRLAEAHRALRADPSIQFQMGPPPPPPAPPAWLKPLGQFFEWLGHLLSPVGRFFGWLISMMPNALYAQIILWIVIAALIGAILWMVIQRVQTGEWQLPGRRVKAARAVEPTPEEEWMPDAEQGRAWLEEADALAAQGLFAEAVHHLLFRSVEDIQRRRPRVVRPALTSRELAAVPEIPAGARDLFARISRHVERSLFGGRAVNAEDWAAARTDYTDFALPRMWKA